MSASTSSPRRNASDGPGETLARHGRLRQRHPLATVFKFLAAAVAVLLVSTGSIAAFAVWNITSAIAPGVALPGDEPGEPPAVGALEGAANILLVGSDSGGGDPQYGERGETLNDVTMLMRISEDHTRATVISFPRDLLVDLPGCTDPDTGIENRAVSYQKFNTALARGGLGCVAASVTNLTGLEVDYAALIEFNGVVAMSNAIGGVTVCVQERINDRHAAGNPFVLEAGQQKLQGQDAFRFLQTRYGVNGGSDLARISNQQLFLSALVREIKSAETLSDPVKLYGIASAASQNMEFSSSLRSINSMVSVALALKDIPTENILFVRYPIVEVTGGVVPIAAAAEELIAAVASDQPFALTGGTGQGTALAEPEATDEPAPSDSAAPDSSEASAEPESPGGAESPDSTTPAVVELPESVEGVAASQETCTLGQTAG